MGGKPFSLRHNIKNKNKMPAISISGHITYFINICLQVEVETLYHSLRRGDGLKRPMKSYIKDSLRLLQVFPIIL